MRREELKTLLKEAKVQDQYYALYPPYPNHECLCLTNEINKWQVYFAERGKKWQLKEFNTEEEACEYFYQEAVE